MLFAVRGLGLPSNGRTLIGRGTPPPLNRWAAEPIGLDRPDILCVGSRGGPRSMAEPSRLEVLNCCETPR